MTQILHPNWWFSFFGQAAPWWFFCAVASVLALPLCLRLFRGLSDRGAALAPTVGVVLTTYGAWLLGLQSLLGSRESAFLRLLFIAAMCLFILVAVLFRSRGYVRGRAGLAIFYPAVLCGIAGFVAVPHGAFAAYIALILLGLGSAACWFADPGGLVKHLRQAAVPFVVGQLLFLIAFLFFVNVRSYLPWATFDLGLYQAEKWGNLTHLTSVMTTEALPPKDIWFNENPTNYYYGGHLLVGTLAKATGTPTRAAFNLGLATIFALTITAGFSFALSLVHLTTRKFRLLGPASWHSGMAWGLFGALAIGMFGNFDAWRQLFTRDVDAGVRIRYVAHQEHLAEEWKLDEGILPSEALNVISSINASESFAAPGNAVRQLEILGNKLVRVPEQLEEIAAAAEQRIHSEGEEITSARRYQLGNQLYTQVFSGQNESVFKLQNARNFIDFREMAFHRLTNGEIDWLVPELRSLAGEHRVLEEELKGLGRQITATAEQTLDSPALEELESALWEAVPDETIQETFGVPADVVRLRLQQAIDAEDYQQVGRELARLNDGAATTREDRSPEGNALAATARAALAELSYDPALTILNYFGGSIPQINTNPRLEDIRFSWANMAFVNFWDSSRIIKGTPPGVREPGTITEFPYFSAILGDLHPHHMAIPFTLAALCACLSLLRKNSRLKEGDRTFFRRSWPDLIAMAFFIGAVFPVNIWDAVVLAPLYAVVLIVARKDVRAGTGWRWLGFAGFIVLLAMVVSIFFNSMPDVTPLFQSFKFFLLAVAVLLGGLKLLPLETERFGRWVAPVIAIAASLMLIALGAFLAPGKGAGATPALTIAIRDMVFFAAFALVAASWTIFRYETPLGNWWYGVGGIYALVGGVSLFITLPFKLFFQSPLQPPKKIFYDLMPPVLSNELTSATGRFWQTFWEASPVNPFPQNLRTDFRDFIMHWGIFFLPILVLAIGRFFKASRGRQPGFAFMIAGIAIGIMALARNYLGYWAGAVSLAMMVLSFYYAITFRKRAEGVIWTFLTVAFFWTWFVEALHFDDDYGGNYERYNTPFKIYYPIWAIFAGGMVVSLRELFGRLSVRMREPRELVLSTEFWVFVVLGGIGVPVLLDLVFPQFIATVWFVVFLAAIALAALALMFAEPRGWQHRLSSALAENINRILAHWPAAAVCLLVGFIGMYYPFAATMVRTRDLHTWPMANSADARLPQKRIYMERTLDATKHLGDFPKYKQDYKALVWMRENLPDEVKILEMYGGAYSSAGRISTGAGYPTILGWDHHEHQWRGRAKSAPPELKAWFYTNIRELYNLEERFSELMGAKVAVLKEERNLLFNAPRQKRLELLQTIIPRANEMQLGQLNKIVEDADGLPDLTKSFKRVIPGIEERVSEPTQRRLRFADLGTRLEILREVFPEQTLETYYQLARIVEQEDVNMLAVFGRMGSDIKEAYLTADPDRAAKILSFYGIDYVVVGEIERGLMEKEATPEQKAAGSLDQKLERWGLEPVYSSGAEESLLPDESLPILGPTNVYRITEDFLQMHGSEDSK